MLANLESYTLLSKPSVMLLLGYAFLLCLCGIVGLIFYRLYLTPLAKFPGPKLAALTYWYEFYYEVILQGQFTFHVQKLHDRYGPIVRITPEEIHIKDSDYWDELYVRSQKADKYERMAGRFGNNGSIFTTSSHELHRTRRAPLNPMFSKRQIVNLQPLISSKVAKLCGRFKDYYQTGGVLDINKAWSAFAGDVITEYSFGLCYDHLDSPDFSKTFHEAFLELGAFTHLALQFPWLHPVMKSLPHGLVRKINPNLKSLLDLQRDLRLRISQLLEKSEKRRDSEHPTIFEQLLNSDLPPEDKSIDRLGDEAQTVVGAGLVTTAWALTTASFHIVNNPRICQILQAELREAIPDHNVSAPDLLEVEKLPYLKACIQEGIRMSYGVAGRIPRLLPVDVVYKKWIIPARTPVSMTILDVHNDESIFPEPQSFKPERWLGNPKAPNGSALDRYLVAFGKGARACLGINLAHAELFLALSVIFRRFSFELYGTDQSDIETAHDFFLPYPRLDTKGVRLRVVSLNP